ncbi:MAG: hypothetical protein RQ862_00820 [Candidatus Caldarchaeales archaeon]|nr:hypothetical protein [Candidatus Caldarchaeales archaeon]
MAFVYQFIGRPATGLDLMNVIRDCLVSAGWTLLREYTDASGNAFKFLQTAPYTMPDNSEAGKAVLELRNLAGTQHVDLKMWSSWDSQNNVPVGPNCPDAFNGSYLRLSYSYQSGLYYWLYANEYWFALLETNNTGGPPYSGSSHKTIAGQALPPAGIPSAPPYKALFVASPYNTAGSMIDAGGGTNFLIHGGFRTVFVALATHTGTNWWSNFQPPGGFLPAAYVGHPDLPPILLPLYLHGHGIIPYAYFTSSSTTPMGVYVRIGNEIWVPIIAAPERGYGQIWARVA